MARILIIHQHASTCAQLSEYMQQMGHTIVGHTQEIDEAIGLNETGKPDIVFLDISFGESHDGTKFAQTVCEQSDMNLVFLVNMVDKAILQLAESLAPRGYLMEPFNQQDVFSCLIRTLDPSQSRMLPAALQTVLASNYEVSSNKLPKAALLRIKAFVRDNLDQEITLDQLAKLAGISYSGFSRRFKASMGITPYQYVIQERIEEAKHLLLHKDLSLAHIAEVTGFSSQSHFTTVFKRSTKLTPLRYRRE